MKIALYILCLIGYLSANAQPDPKNYYEFKDKKQLVFADDFDDDRNNWLLLRPAGCPPPDKGDPIISGDSCYINNGIFRFDIQPKERTGRGYLYEISTDIDFNRNLEIEFKAYIKGDKDNHNIGISYWGKPCNSINGFNVYFGHKWVRIFYSNEQFEKSVHPDIDKSLPISKHNRNETFNTYVIRKYNSKYYVFVNDEYIGKCPFIPLTGNILGLGKSSNNSGEFDYIKIFYLPD